MRIAGTSVVTLSGFLNVHVFGHPGSWVVAMIVWFTEVPKFLARVIRGHRPSEPNTGCKGRNRMNRLMGFLFVLVSAGSIVSAEEGKVFLLGNSLTWDTVPAKLDGDVQWHVDCGKSLPYIVDNPSDPCVKSSTLWPKALQEKQYDVISIQVHYGSTLKEDVASVLKLIENQPNARVVIHTGWARSIERSAEWSNGSNASSVTMKHHRGYFDALLTNLRSSRPEQEFSRSYAMDLLQVVATDIQSGESRIGSVNELYRDAIHMNVVTGRYLMHNAMRDALGQQRSASGFEKLKPQIKSYLDSVLDRGLNQEKTSSGN
jgi:hypothetical protein